MQLETLNVIWLPKQHWLVGGSNFLLFFDYCVHVSRNVWKHDYCYLYKCYFIIITLSFI